MARGLLGFEPEEAVSKSRGGNAFIWSIVLLLLTGAALTSWIGSFYIVGHPEKPACYRILKKLKKLDPPKEFAVTKGPQGRFFSPKQLLEGMPRMKAEDLVGFGKMRKPEIAARNGEMMRMYLKNYQEAKKAVPYIAGVFEVIESHELGAGDFFPSGVVAVAQAKDFPQVLVELVFPAAAASTKTVKGLLPTGREITLERSKDLAAVIHAERLSDSRMLFTVMPLSYGSFQLKEGLGSFTLKSPQDLEDPEKGGSPKNAININGSLPIVNGLRLQRSLAAYQEYRRKLLASNDGERPAANQVVAFRANSPDGEKVEIATPVVLRQAPAPPPAPIAQPQPPTAITKIATPTPKPPLISFAGPTTPPERFPIPPRPIVRAAPKEPAPPAPTPVEAEPPKPVVISKAASPVVKPLAGPVELPPAPQKRQLLSTKDASALVDRFDPSAEPLLGGDFVVTGVLGQRVALRAREALRDPDADPTVAGTTGAMIVVDFPKGVVPPAKDEVFSRGGKDAFVIKSVGRSGSGQITIFAEDPVKQ